MRFTALDFETANHHRSSICQIGVVSFVDGSVAKTWQRLVNPEDHFDPVNVSIHGITDDAVKHAPTFPELFPDLKDLLTDQVVVCHTGFDRVSLARAAEKHELPAIECTWLDSSRVVRRTWPAHAYSGYGLASITRELGIDFKHHEAQEDARAAGEVVLRAIAETGRTLEEWLVRVHQPISTETGHPISSKKLRIALEGNPDGSLAGEVAVFTGELSITRQEAAELAANVGCTVAASVTQKTTLLIVGDQDPRKLSGHKKSSKHRKAEILIEKGQPICIIAEDDFRRLLKIESAI